MHRNVTTIYYVRKIEPLSIFPSRSIISLSDYYEERSWSERVYIDANRLADQWMLEYHEIQQIMLEQDIGWDQAKFLYELRKKVEAGMDTTSLFWDLDGVFGSSDQNAPAPPDTSWKHPASSRREHSIRSPRGQFREVYLKGLKQGTLYTREE